MSGKHPRLHEARGPVLITIASFDGEPSLKTFHDLGHFMCNFGCSERNLARFDLSLTFSGAVRQGSSNGGGFPIWAHPSRFVLLCPFGLSNFSGFARSVRGFSQFVRVFLSSRKGPTRNIPKRVWGYNQDLSPKKGANPRLEKPSGLPSPYMSTYFLTFPMSTSREGSIDGTIALQFARHGSTQFTACCASSA